MLKDSPESVESVKINLVKVESRTLKKKWFIVEIGIVVSVDSLCF
jgi:hypothetical protein